MNDDDLIVGNGWTGGSSLAFALLLAEPAPVPPHVQVIKTGPAEVQAGGEIVYRFWVSNLGDVTTEVTLRDAAPEGTAFEAAANPGWTDAGGQLEISVDVPPASVSGALPVELVLRVQVGEGEIVNEGFTAVLADGAEQTIASPVTTTVENAPPTVALIGVAPCRAVAVGEQLDLAATAVDPDGAAVQVTFLADDAPLASQTSPPFSATWVAADPGVHCVAARAEDPCGATSTHRICVDVGGDGAPPASYAFEILPVPDSSFTSSAGFAISENGHVAGMASDGTERPCRWAPGLECLAQERGVAYHVEDSGYAAGWVLDASGSAPLWWPAAGPHASSPGPGIIARRTASGLVAIDVPGLQAVLGGPQRRHPIVRCARRGFHGASPSDRRQRERPVRGDPRRPLRFPGPDLPDPPGLTDRAARAAGRLRPGVDLRRDQRERDGRGHGRGGALLHGRAAVTVARDGRAYRPGRGSGHG